MKPPSGTVDGCQFLLRVLKHAAMASLLVCLAVAACSAGTPTRPAFEVDFRSPTADKPQSKLWYAQGCWWALLPTSTGPSLWQRAAGGWREQESARKTLAGLPGRCDVWFDNDGATAVGVAGTELAVVRLTYDAASSSWGTRVLARWNTGSATPVETATMARDSSGVWWIAAPVTPSLEKSAKKTKAGSDRDVVVWHSPDAVTWEKLPPLETGIGGDDICLVTPIGKNVGVAWSDQNRDRIGFRVHKSDNASDAWETAEIAAEGGLTADDHLNAAFASNGRLWLATKNSIDAAGQPQLVLRVREPSGTWTSIPYATRTHDGAPSRPIVVLAPGENSLLLCHTIYMPKETRNRGTIASECASTSANAIPDAFTPVIAPGVAQKSRINDVTGPKAAFPKNAPWIVIASDEEGNIFEADLNPDAGVVRDEAHPRVVTEKVRWDSDDPAIWINEKEPGKSLVIGTDKNSDGALYAFDLEGRIARRAGGLKRPNNVDVLNGFMLGGNPVDIAVVTERETGRLRVFSLPGLECIDAGDLLVFGGDKKRAPMGIALYRRPRDDAVFAFVSGKSGPRDGYIGQYRLCDNGAGRVTMALVREFGRYSGLKEIESIAVDAELGYVYYSDEKYGVRKYNADPDAADASRELALFAAAGFASDHEGISIYKTGERTGYILVSDQQTDSFWIFPREGEPGDAHAHKPVKIIKVAAHESDGSDVTARYLGPRFPSGMFVAMSADRTFHYYAWEDIAGNNLRVVPAGPPMAAKGGDMLRFTVTSDPHMRPENYDHVLAAIQRHSGGPGAFHVVVGDLCQTPGQTPQALRDRFDAHFGKEVRWLPVVGNHDAEVASVSESISWQRTEFATGHDGRNSLRAKGVNPGPPGCEETTYSWNEGNAHFVMLNLYWNGETGPGSDAAGNGDVVPALLDWLKHDLTANTMPFVFVFGHEPAFPQYRHIGDSLDQHPENRDAFWALLARHKVQAYICGHVHSYFKERRDGVWQVCNGHAGRARGGDRVYLDVLVGQTEAEIRVWKSTGDSWADWKQWDTIRLDSVQNAKAARAGKPLDTPERDDSMKAILMDELPLLFADDSGVSECSGITRTLHPARTRAGPVLQAEKPWEGDRVYVYGTVMRDEASSGYRLWYMGNAEKTTATDRSPTLRGNINTFALFATSRDGVAWAKPKLGLHVFNGSTDNNIVYDLASASVIFDTFERDPRRRYKLLGYHRGHCHAAVSPDGLRWTSASSIEGAFRSGDTMTFTQNPATGEYLAYHKRSGQEGRKVWLTRSRDFKTWSDPELVFASDEADNAWAAKPGQRTEIYDMSVLPHAAGFIGFPAVFRIETITEKSKLAPRQSGHDGPIDIQLATSCDGRTWQRSMPRAPMIPRGAHGDYDSGVLLGLANGAIHTERETWMYYTAINTGHGAPMPPKRVTIGRAEWRLHGFVSLDAGTSGGRVETVPLRLAAANLIVNADASRGVLRVGLLETDGRPIKGFEASACEPLRTDETRWVARWRDEQKIPTERAVRVVIEMTDAKLYSLANRQAN